MADVEGKKVIILYILQILRKYTDIDHRMTQQDIADKLWSDYGLEINRATVKRNISDLIDAHYPIQFDEHIRTYRKKNGETEENSIYTNLYYEHDITESELRLLIDGLLFSRSVPYNQRRQLIDKLGGLSSAYFNQRMNHMRCMSADSPANAQLFYNIERLDEAIGAGKQVRIIYGHYGTDLELHPVLNEDGTEKVQVLNPYQLAANEGRYYLICNNDKYDSVANYRIDRIMKIDVLDTPSRPASQVRGLENGLNLSDYVFQNLNMFTSPPEDVEFTVGKNFVSLVIDFFGKYVHFFEQPDGTVNCRLKVSRMAMKQWAVEHAAIVKVTSPPGLVDEIREALRKAMENYGLDAR
jgi:predicted DNA-binding transcriptional regulator YafY